MRRERIVESKNVQTTLTRTHCKRSRPLPYSNQNCRTLRHWKITQHHPTTRLPSQECWLVGCFGFNGPLRQYSSLCRAVSQREGEGGEMIDESKNVQTTPTRTYCKHNRPLPYLNQNCRTPQHWKFTQHHRTTHPPPPPPPPPPRFKNKQNPIWSKALTMPWIVWHYVLSSKQSSNF